MRPDRNAFSVDRWATADGTVLADGDLVSGWDQSTALAVSRQIEIDLQVMARTGRLSGDARLALVATWWSEGTGLRGAAEAIALSADHAGASPARFEQRMVVPGRDLAGNLQLRSALVLLDPGASMIGDPLAARRSGSILWEDSVSVVLEGQASRFPITVVSFAETDLGPENACWHFAWSPPDPCLPAMATMRLYINSKHSAFHSAVTSEEPAPEQKAMRSALKYAVAEEMLRLALDNAEEIEAAAGDYSKTSAGHVLLELVGRLFPGRSLVACREYRASDPGRFQAEVQARMALFSRGGYAGESR